MVGVCLTRWVPPLVTRRFMACARGSESAESVVALPLICIVIFTGLEYGWLALRSLQVDAAARAGARQAAMAGVSASAIEDAVTSALRRAGMTAASVTITPSDPSEASAGEVVTIEVAVDYSEVGLMGLGRLMPLPESVSGRAAMVKEPGP
jgi:Flp pilus assembly protein TadG